MLDDLIKEAANRRDVFKKLGVTALGAALLADAGFDPADPADRFPGRQPVVVRLAVVRPGSDVEPRSDRGFRGADPALTGHVLPLA